MLFWTRLGVVCHALLHAQTRASASLGQEAEHVAAAHTRTVSGVWVFGIGFDVVEHGFLDGNTLAQVQQQDTEHVAAAHTRTVSGVLGFWDLF